MRAIPESPSKLVDATSTLRTFAGVDTEIRTAGIYVRGVARLIDDVLRLMLLFIVGVGAALSGVFGVTFGLIASFMVLWFYNVFFEVIYNGMTPGKKLMGLRAVCEDGTPIGFVNSVIRSTLLFVDALPMVYTLGIVVMCLTEKRQRIGDVVAGTVVIYDQPIKKSPSSLAGPTRPFPVPLTTEEKLLFEDFRDRLPDLSKERAVEIAETLEPVLECKGSNALNYVLDVARGIRQGE